MRVLFRVQEQALLPDRLWSEQVKSCSPAVSVLSWAAAAVGAGSPRGVSEAASSAAAASDSGRPGTTEPSCRAGC
jgi:hypothetical protein